MRLTLGKKLGLGFGAILALMTLSAGISYQKSAVIRKSQDMTVDMRFPTLVTCTKMQGDLNNAANEGRQAILAGTEPGRREAANRRFHEAWSDIENDVALLEQFAPKWTVQQKRDQLQHIKEDLPALRNAQESAMMHAATGEQDAIGKAADEFYEEATTELDAIKASLGEMITSFNDVVAKNKEELHRESRIQTLTMAGTTLSALAIGISLAVFLSRRISSSSQSILAQTQAIAAGDLTRPEMKIESSDELGEMTRAINGMQTSLSKVIQSIRETAEQVAAASGELSATGQQITANSEETTAQAKVVSEAGTQVNTNLQTLASGAEEMNSTIGEIAKNATEAARVSGEAVEAADSANQTVTRLGDSSFEIEKVIEVITSIAQQTNLLALNATIEAARAGEAGKGFAVVANEVKELAKQTAKATEEIKQKISVIRENTGGAVTAISGIKGVIDKVSQISTTIATAVEEQSATTSEMARNVTEAARGASTISDNIKGVAEAAESTSTNVAESQTATEHLSKMANELRDLVGQFKVGAVEERQHGHRSSRKAAGQAAGAL